MNSDSDSDGLSNIDEINKHKTNPYDIDTDKDYVSDKDEIIANTDPLDKNSYPTVMGYTHKQRDEIFKTIDTSAHLDKNLVTFNLPIFCYSLKHSIPMEVIYEDSDNITSNKTVDLKVVPTNPVKINVQRPTKLIKIELKFFDKSITIDVN